MFCAVYVVYTIRGKVYRDRIAHNLLLSDAEAMVKERQGHGYTRIDLVTYPAWPFVAGPVAETVIASVA